MAYLFGVLGISASSLVNTFLNATSGWIEAGAVAIVNGVGVVLGETTSVTFGSAFTGLYGSMRTIGGAFALPFIVAATIQALVRQDAASLVRTILVRAPVALIGSGIAIWLVQGGLVVTDAIASALLGGQGSGGAQFTSNLAGLLIGPNSALSGSEGVLLALVTAAAAFFLWIELVVRSSALLCASLFIPLALAGVIWPVTAHWIRRLGETIGALVLAKVAMVAVLVLGVESIGESSGVAGVIEGASILLLASFAPFALLRMLPFIESGASTQFEGIGQRGVRSAGPALARVANAFEGGGDQDITPERDPLPWMSGEPADSGSFRRTYRQVLGEIEQYNQTRDPDEGAAQS